MFNFHMNVHCAYRVPCYRLITTYFSVYNCSFFMNKFIFHRRISTDMLKIIRFLRQVYIVFIAKFHDFYTRRLNNY